MVVVSGCCCGHGDGKDDTDNVMNDADVFLYENKM